MVTSGYVFKSMFRSRFAQPLVVGAMLLSLLLVACAAPPANADSKSRQDPATPPDQSVAHGSAEVEELDILVLDSTPARVSVVARGYLRDGCTEIAGIRQAFDAATNTFSIRITTVRRTEAACTLALVPFEERISLDVLGLPAGTYTVDVNGVGDTFALDIDNVPPDGQDGDPARDPLTPRLPPVTQRTAEVEEISIRIMESFPLQVAVVARGHLRDGCTRIAEVRQTFDAATDTFLVEIKTARSTGAFCTMALVPFEERISLDVHGLPAGTYTVNVNGVTDTFTLDVDNSLPDDDQSVTYGLAEIENIDILGTESFPVQVTVVADGYVGDGCTEVHQIRRTFDAATNTFFVEITTARPTEAICTMVLQALQERVPLDVHGLPAGTYTVDVNGVVGTFTLDVDNAPAPDSGS